MSANRILEVKALSRVEGEGALYVRLDGDQVEHVELNIYEPPRFFESFLRGRAIHEVPDITARICGICPVAYQMSSCHALEHILGIRVPAEIRALRRLLYCAEWIESHSLHIHLLHAPDFLGYESGISMAADYRDVVERGLRIKKIGNALLEALGGRAIHPINVTVGGFHRAPGRDDVRKLIPDLKWGMSASIEVLKLVATLEFPDFDQDYDFVSLRHSTEYPMNEGRVVSSRGLNIPVEEYEQHFQERHEERSTALHSVRIPDDATYLVGPLARFNNCFDELSPTARREVEQARVDWPLRNNFKSIIARAVELIDAFEEAIAIVRTYNTEPTQPRIPYDPKPGEACHATEAPRGLIYHRYRIGDDGLIAEAKIVPPTSQNQRQIESDLKNYIPQVTALENPEAARRCEQLLRNFDPCISCATHSLKLSIDNGTGT